MQPAVKTDPKQPFIEYLERTKEDLRPWSENGENWLTGEGLSPVEYPLSPHWTERESQKTGVI